MSIYPTTCKYLLTLLCMGLGWLNLSAKKMTAFSLQDFGANDGWYSVNDNVMGGVSTGGFNVTEKNTLLFSGNLSLKNNGGFASIRSKGDLVSLKDATSIIIEARGDGRTYWVGLREANQNGASSFRAYMPTIDGELKTLRIPISEFDYQSFGRRIPLRKLKPEDVKSIGFTIADKREGPFQLEVTSIEIAYGAGDSELKSEKSTLVDIAKEAGNFETLLAAATSAGLVDALIGDGPLTIFAPTDQAFAALPDGTINNLLKPENKQQLTNILKYHVVRGEIRLADALKAQKAVTLQGKPITVYFDNGSVKVGEAKLTKADISASNGIIHIIDKVLLPPVTNTTPLNPKELIALAIERGVPIYNNGDPAACAAVYEITIQGLRSASGLSNETREQLVKALDQSRDSKSAVNQAWILRSALDRAYHRLNDGI